ncbi:MAG: UDP-N-acetyl-D-glucosamine dehydrogenase, partial [Anaerolineaceae bacterium]|nr:UDP-N-acetyl-D-glucosamine dehydrogenase [Anaerolineaceae bacterium]
MNTKQRLIEKFEKKEAKIAILGMGYVGLPLAVVFAEAGFDVTGIDPIQEKVDLLNKGKSYIIDVPTEQVKKLIGEKRLHATSDFSVLREMDAVSICVPTPLRKTGDPDLSFIISATESLSQYIHPGMVV